MGEAKRRRGDGPAAPHCRGCDACCTLPDIAALDKPMYHACRHLAGSGCGVFGRPERPKTCIAYECAYLSARRRGPTRIPHPLDCGAHFHVDPIENVVVLFVDPDRPELWKTTALPDHLRPLLAEGRSMLVIDRGRRMVISSPFLFEAILKRDYVAFAQAQGKPLDIPSFADR